MEILLPLIGGVILAAIAILVVLYKAARFIVHALFGE